MTLHHTPEEPDLVEVEVTGAVLEDVTQSALRRRILQRARQLANRLSEPEVVGRQERESGRSTGRGPDPG